VNCQNDWTDFFADLCLFLFLLFPPHFLPTRKSAFNFKLNFYLV
jgi:hypothetical protein